MKCVLAMALLLGASIVAHEARADDLPADCAYVRSVVTSKGLAFVMNFEVVDLFDATSKQTKTVQFNLVPTVTSDCHDIGQLGPVFTLGRDTIIQLGNSSLAATLDENSSEVSEIMVMGPQNFDFAVGSDVVVHHAVLAALVQSMGFDTFESVSSGTFSPLLTLGLDGREPLIIGAAGTNGKLYQVTRGTYSYTLPSPR